MEKYKNNKYQTRRGAAKSQPDWRKAFLSHSQLIKEEEGRIVTTHFLRAPKKNKQKNHFLHLYFSSGRERPETDKGLCRERKSRARSQRQWSFERENMTKREMGTLQTWRKAYGALKDQTKVGLAHVNSDFKDVHVAIVKATNHVECPPKERHLRKILISTSAIRPRADVLYCLHALARRLAKTHNWTITGKLIVAYPNSGETWDDIAKKWLASYKDFLKSSNASIFLSISLTMDTQGLISVYIMALCVHPSKCFDDDKFDLFATKWHYSGAKLIGGCCRTTPYTIKAISRVLKEKS